MRRIFALTLALVLTFGASATAFAAWSASGSGSAAASSGTIHPPAGVSATSTGTTVDVAWTAPGSGATPASYTVVRQPASGNGGSSATVCTPSHPTTSCSDSGVPAGDWTYAVTAHLGQWISEAVVSSTVTVVDAPAEEAFQVILLPSGTKTAGDSFNVEITAMDDGVKQTAYTGSKSLTFSGPGASPNGSSPVYPSSVTFNSGVGIATITLNKAEAVTLQVSDGSRDGSVSVSVQPGIAALSFSSCPGSIQHNRDYTTSIKRATTDAYGNSAVGSSAQVDFTTSGNGAVSTNSVTIAVNSDTSPSFTIRVNGNNQTGTITATSPGYTSASCTLNS